MSFEIENESAVSMTVVMDATADCDNVKNFQVVYQVTW